MNTNSNIYTVIYTTIVVVIVAAALAFVSMKLGPAQQANAKAETLRQMMAAAQVEPTEALYAKKNAEVLALYAENIDSAFTIDLEGNIISTLNTEKNSIELIANLKAQDKEIKKGAGATLPVYVFKGGISVMPIYGAGLWGPVWGYVAIESDGTTIKGAYFDHESETPGLGGKIKDEPWFREKFSGKQVAFGSEPAFALAKNAESTGAANAVDAITGATMTSKGLDGALNVWFNAYSNFFGKMKAECSECAEESCCENCENKVEE